MDYIHKMIKDKIKLVHNEAIRVTIVSSRYRMHIISDKCYFNTSVSDACGYDSVYNGAHHKNDTTSMFEMEVTKCIPVFDLFVNS